MKKKMKNAATWTAYVKSWGGATGKESNEERPEAIAEASAAAAAAVDDFADVDDYAEEQSG
jgi:hypothetical protein